MPEVTVYILCNKEVSSTFISEILIVLFLLAEEDDILYSRQLISPVALAMKVGNNTWLLKRALQLPVTSSVNLIRSKR